MFKGFLTWFVIICLLIAIILYAYGKRTVSNMSTPQTETYVESKLEAATPTQNWIDYTPPTKKFTAKFPTPPQHAVDRSKDSKTKELKQYEMYVSENDGKVFMISVISFLESDQKKDEDEILKNVVDDMVASNTGNKLEKIKYGYYEGHRDANFEIVNSNYSLQGFAFVDSNQLYVISTLSQKPGQFKEEFDYFVKSFDLHKVISSDKVIPKEQQVPEEKVK